MVLHQRKNRLQSKSAWICEIWSDGSSSLVEVEVLNFLLRENLHLTCTEGELVGIRMFWQLLLLFEMCHLRVNSVQMRSCLKYVVCIMHVVNRHELLPLKLHYLVSSSAWLNGTGKAVNAWSKTWFGGKTQYTERWESGIKSIPILWETVQDYLCFQANRSLQYGLVLCFLLADVLQYSSRIQSKWLFPHMTRVVLGPDAVITLWRPFVFVIGRGVIYICKHIFNNQLQDVFLH